jgi:hypothetical protein
MKCRTFFDIIFVIIVSSASSNSIIQFILKFKFTFQLNLIYYLVILKYSC